MRETHRITLLLLALWLAMPMEGFSRPPNIVYILADDLGWTDLGCQGSLYYKTPNIDRLASEGARLTRFYTCQNCAPTRAALMSGQHGARTGVYTVGSGERGRAADRAMSPPRNVAELPLNIELLPAALQRAGYASGMFGKWHLGDQGPHHPGKRGFQEAIVSDGRHFGFSTPPGAPAHEGQYLADYLTDRALDFIQRHKEGPFFLYLPHFAVHSPIVARPAYEAEWKTRPPSGAHWNPTYAAMIQSLDDSVGRIMRELDSLGLAGETLVIFSSDNGGVGGYQRTEPPSKRRGVTDNAPLRGGKGTLYEGGLRVPFIARWPGVIPPGATSATPMAHLDVYPTLLAAAGGTPPAGQPMDGLNMLPSLKNPAEPGPERPIFWHFPGYLESYVHDTGWRATPTGAVHLGHFKLIQFFETGRLELYDLEADPGEAADLAASRPEVVAALRERLEAWRREIKAPMPEFKRSARLAPAQPAPSRFSFSGAPVHSKLIPITP